MSAFDRIAGYEKEKEELRSLVEIFSHRKKYEKKGATLPKGIIFYGEAGTGKTLFSEVLAEECNLKKIIISLSDSTSQNSICKKIKKAFLQGAKSKKPTMIFFDELDKLLPNDAEEYYTDRAKTILTQLLTLIDGMEKTDNIVFVATCNNYYSLPASITRAGRFDKKIGFDLPDYASRVAILHLYMNASPAKFDMSAESIAKLTGGFSPAALKTLVNDCLLTSDENNFVSEDLIREKIREIKEEDLPGERSEQSYKVDAVRNIGAFIMARSYSGSEYVLTVEEDKVCNHFLDSLIRDADYDDYDDDDYDDDCDDDYDGEDEGSSFSKEAFSCYSKNDCIAAITALLGGFAAEELVFGKIYDNLSDRLSAVDSILLKMSSCGMLGFATYYNSSYSNDVTYSEKYLQHIEETFLKTKQECYEKAKEMLTKNEELIKKLVPILIKRKSIEKAECEILLEELGGIAVL